MEDFAKGIVASCFHQGLPVEKTAAILETAILDKMMQDPDIQAGVVQRLSGLPETALQKIATFLQSPENRRRIATQAFSDFVPKPHSNN